MSSDNELERSLLQKAVRRGDVELTGKVIKYLLSKGDQSWLRKRLYVMAYEECWTFAHKLNPDKLYESYTALALTVKNKNAAGLASLALRYNGNDKSVLSGNNQDIKDVAEAIQNPVAFWESIKSKPGYDVLVANAAEQNIKKASFPDDKAMMIAAAHLSSRYPIPGTVSLTPNNDPDFPYWIAIDKHTSVGKTVYKEACREIAVDPYAGMLIGFYLEGAVCNQLTDSSLWTQQKVLELSRHGYTIESAQKVWKRLQPVIIWKTQSESESLIKRINSPDDDQLSLF